MKLVAATVLVATLAALALSTTASAATTSNWYWTPGACKSELQKFGVAINDGRTFNVEKAYCIGLHNHCWLNDGLRRFKVFIAVMRSYDGVVRELQLTVTGKSTWSGSKMEVLEHFMSLSEFNTNYGTAAWTVANTENQGGCFDIHP
jgi:hypothetical protein